LKLATMRKTLFDTLETSHFQQLKDLFSTHLKLSMNWRTFFHTFSRWNLILSKTWRISFSHLKNLQHFEEISSTPSTHLEMDSYSLCNLAK
jgi:hypothetical protein